VVALMCWNLVCGETIDQDFDCRPGKEEPVSVSLKGYSCTFNYRATGGTNEQWRMTLSDDSGHPTCFVGRPVPPSYLLFQSFSITIEGKDGTISDAEVWDNSGMIANRDNFIVAENKVREGKNWGGNLALAIVHAGKH